jgi:hypothetical protein
LINNQISDSDISRDENFLERFEKTEHRREIIADSFPNALIEYGQCYLNLLSDDEEENMMYQSGYHFDELDY